MVEKIYEIHIRGTMLKRKSFEEASNVQKVLFEMGIPEVTVRPFRVQKPVEDDEIGGIY